MCYSAPSWTKPGSGQFGAPSIKASLSPGYGLQDISNTVQGKPRDGSNFVLNALAPDIPDPQAPLPPPQTAKLPDTTPLKRRNSSGGIAVPQGSTLLSGPNGISTASLNLGGQTLLGGN